MMLFVVAKNKVGSMPDARLKCKDLVGLEASKETFAITKEGCVVMKTSSAKLAVEQDDLQAAHKVGLIPDASLKGEDLYAKLVVDELGSLATNKVGATPEASVKGNALVGLGAGEQTFAEAKIDFLPMETSIELVVDELGSQATTKVGPMPDASVKAFGADKETSLANAKEGCLATKEGCLAMKASAKLVPDELGSQTSNKVDSTPEESLKGKVLVGLGAGNIVANNEDRLAMRASAKLVADDRSSQATNKIGSTSSFASVNAADLGSLGAGKETLADTKEGRLTMNLQATKGFDCAGKETLAANIKEGRLTMKGSSERTGDKPALQATNKIISQSDMRVKHTASDAAEECGLLAMKAPDLRFPFCSLKRKKRGKTEKKIHKMDYRKLMFAALLVICPLATSFDCTNSSVCDDININTKDTCDTTKGCLYECDDMNACTSESFDADNNCIPTDIVCDDGNPNTIETCDIITGCVYVCDDHNACTEEAFDADGNCVPEVIVCDDNDSTTLDICVPARGCAYIDMSFPDINNFDTVYTAVLESFGDDVYFYEDEPGTELTPLATKGILNWINTEVVQVRTPFCYRQSYARGWGRTLSECPQGKEKIGLLCYTPCKSGYSRQGTFDCQQECLDGWRDDGLFCRMAEYGRTAGYPWQFGDALNDSGMFSRCQAQHGTCEKYGLIVYPTCAAGYNNFGCCICRPPVPNCVSEGYASAGVDLSCPVKIESGDPTPLICPSDMEQDGLLCYPKCIPGYNGIAPVCWQLCDEDQTECGVGCAKDDLTCVSQTVDFVLSVAVVAANIATLGLSSAPAGAAKTVTLGSKTVAYSNRASYVMLRTANVLQSVQPTNLVKGASVFQRIRASKELKFTGKVFAEAYGTFNTYSHVFAEEFARMTSQTISDYLDETLSPGDAFYIKQLWASKTFAEVSAAEDWNIASTVLAVASLVDITGISGVISAFAKPTCGNIVAFPKLAGNSDPQAQCKNIEALTSSDSNCEVLVPAFDIDNNSIDPDGDQLSYSLSPIGPFGLSKTAVTLTVTDRDSSFDSCDAFITVSDITPATISCPFSVTQSNDLGECSAMAAYAAPNVSDNCQAESTVLQVKGFPSGSSFPVGDTSNEFRLQPGTTSCNFKVYVRDTEAPSVSCDGLAKTIVTDFDKCSTVYTYKEPVGTDNCDAEVTTSKVEGTLYDLPFPLGTTTTTYDAADSSGNTAVCSFDVTVEDGQKPDIECPGEIIRACNDIDPFVTGTPETNDNCDADLEVTYSDDSSDSISDDCPQITIRTWMSQDDAGNSNDCFQKIIEVGSDALTTGSFCMFDADPAMAGQQFRTIFTPGKKRGGKGNNIPYSNYKLTATNPGLFFYNVFHVGIPGEIALFELDIPYPFVTHGASPMHAYDWLDLASGDNDEPCFVPDDEDGAFFVDSHTITLEDYGKRGSCGDTTTVNYNLTIPDSGFIYLNIHLDLGLETTKNVAKRASSKKGKGSDKVILENPCPFAFSVRGAQSSTTTVENINMYKPESNPGVSGFALPERNPGVSGFALKQDGNPVVGATVRLIHPTNGEVGSAVTDGDGYHQIVYEHYGTHLDYLVVLDGSSIEIEVELKKNGFSVANFFYGADSTL